MSHGSRPSSQTEPLACTCLSSHCHSHRPPDSCTAHVGANPSPRCPPQLSQVLISDPSLSSPSTSGRSLKPAEVFLNPPLLTAVTVLEPLHPSATATHSRPDNPFPTQQQERASSNMHPLNHSSKDTSNGLPLHLRSIFHPNPLVWPLRLLTLRPWPPPRPNRSSHCPPRRAPQSPEPAGGRGAQGRQACSWGSLTQWRNHF